MHPDREEDALRAARKKEYLVQVLIAIALVLVALVALWQSDV